jgi:hypothetical protein
MGRGSTLDIAHGIDEIDQMSRNLGSFRVSSL